MMDLGAFGSEEWLKSQLRQVLLQARDAYWHECKKRIPLPEGTEIDFDSYSHILISKKQKKVTKLLEEIAKTIEQLNFSRQLGILYIGPPQGVTSIEHKYVEHWATIAAVEILKKGGIDCSEYTSYRN